MGFICEASTWHFIKGGVACKSANRHFHDSRNRKMNLVVVLTFCLVACSLSASVPSEDISKPHQQKHEFSEKAKFLLREASLRAISYLCFGDDVLQEIYDTICVKAINKQFAKEPSIYGATPFGSNCIDCEVADPICWDSCPQ
ncbi:uncharacterized protein LOC143449512 [Clavelina lepadiformis]